MRDARAKDWELAKVALSCQMALDMLFQEMFEVERKRGWFGFWAGRQALVYWAGLSESFEFCYSWNI